MSMGGSRTLTCLWVAVGLTCLWVAIGLSRDGSMGGCRTQGRLIINNRYTQREFKFKFSGLLKDDDHKYTENGKKSLNKT